MKFRYWMLVLLVLSLILPETSYSEGKNPGLAVHNPGTRLAYITHNGQPLLAFGCHFEYMLFDDYDYKHWTAWAVQHGINHCRTRLYHAYYRKHSPFLKTENGKYDLTQWDESYWERFHEIVPYLESRGIIVHLLIFPQGTGGYWWQGDKYYLPENNVHPETAFIRPNKNTAGFWQSLARGKRKLYEIQTAILWKLIDETAEYDNIYYDLCHEPFIHAMDLDARQDMQVFLEETSKRFVRIYQELRPDKVPVLGLDTDFTPPGPMRDWIYNHDRFNLMIQGQNHDQFYSTTSEAIALRKRFGKPFCPQESLDPPGIIHIPDIKHTNALTYFDPQLRTHLRKYVWRWIMAKSQLIDIYQKSLSTEKERYEPFKHSEFENDALIIRNFWTELTDYPHLDFQGAVEAGPGTVQMVLSSPREAVAYFSSRVGAENRTFEAQELQLVRLGLADGEYDVEIWKPSAMGGVMKRTSCNVEDGSALIELPAFVDDLVVHILD